MHIGNKSKHVVDNYVFFVMFEKSRLENFHAELIGAGQAKRHLELNRLDEVEKGVGLAPLREGP